MIWAGFPVAADVDGSLEAIQSSLATYTSPLVEMDMLASGAGEVTENDVEMAELFNGGLYRHLIMSI